MQQIMQKKPLFSVALIQKNYSWQELKTNLILHIKSILYGAPFEHLADVLFTGSTTTYLHLKNEKIFILNKYLGGYSFLEQ